MYECTVTLNLETQTLSNFLDCMRHQTETAFITFAALAWPFPHIEDRDIRICKFALESTNNEENCHEILLQNGYRYFQDEPLWRPAEIDNLSFPGRVKAFFIEREMKGFDICSTIGAWPQKYGWRVALGFSDKDLRDNVALPILEAIQMDEQNKAVSAAKTNAQRENAKKHFRISKREGYDVLERFDGKRRISDIIRVFDTGGIDKWVYHAAVTDWGDVRHVRFFTYVHDPATRDRHRETDSISRRVLDEHKIEYTPHYILRMMFCRDPENLKRTLTPLYQAVAALAQNNVWMDSIQTIVPPKMEEDDLPLLYSVSPDQEEQLRHDPAL